MNAQPPTTDSNGREPVLDLSNFTEIALWLASAVASGVIGTAAYNYLKAVQRRFGRDRVAELQEQVYQALKRVKRKPNVSDQDLRLRVEALFRDYEDY
ncbi:MAG: hypothetical protein KDJ22_05860 [Candidatus Competibacteraceae bacterium]|nr:hypothetical protein [Candidatus Competibacteraceae bacterium]MCP5124789.1 hypothetical protein [Gammaproteobacteria bacterium]HRX70888.1 hypothetical protein [Candidatus Competibacteraceae bacterium]